LLCVVCCVLCGVLCGVQCVVVGVRRFYLPDNISFVHQTLSLLSPLSLVCVVYCVYLARSRLQWLRAEQRAGTAFKVIASGGMWSNDGDMFDYQANREAIFDFIVSEGVTGVMYAHALRAQWCTSQCFACSFISLLSFAHPNKTHLFSNVSHIFSPSQLQNPKWRCSHCCRIQLPKRCHLGICRFAHSSDTVVSQRSRAVAV